MAPLSYYLLSTLALLSTGASSLSTNSAVLDLIPSNFDSVVFESGKPALVEFFAPWCGHCKTLAPVYEELAQSYVFASDKVSIAKVDADAEKDLGQKYGVRGFPTLKWFDGVKGSEPEDYTGGRDLESLQKFVAEKTGVRAKGKVEVPSEVVMLSDANFKEAVGGEKGVLVAFTAPWCGRMFYLSFFYVGNTCGFLLTMAVDCKSLAPIWEQVARDFANEPEVVIAKVDADSEGSKTTAQEQGIASYPTIKFFPKGSTEPVDYTGGRSEAAFIDFLNENTGTHRVVGGGLDSNAGTIEALDEIIAKHVTGETLSQAAEEVKKAADGLQEKFASYYVRVLGKLEENGEYVTKEFARLQKILNNSELQPEKADELVSKSNILRKFMGEEKVKDEL